MTKKQLETRIETINTLIASFGDEDGKLAKELNEAYKKLRKQERMEKLEREEKATAEEFEKWMKENPEEYEEYCNYHEYLDNKYLERLDVEETLDFDEYEDEYEDEEWYEYEDFDEQPSLWVQFLGERFGCYPDSVGNMPCDNGRVCDKCHFADTEFQQFKKGRE